MRGARVAEGGGACRQGGLMQLLAGGRSARQATSIGASHCAHLHALPPLHTSPHLPSSAAAVACPFVHAGNFLCAIRGPVCPCVALWALSQPVYLPRPSHITPPTLSHIIPFATSTRHPLHTSTPALAPPTDQRTLRPRPFYLCMEQRCRLLQRSWSAAGVGPPRAVPLRHPVEQHLRGGS